MVFIGPFLYYTMEPIFTVVLQTCAAPLLNVLQVHWLACIELYFPIQMKSQFIFLFYIGSLVNIKSFRVFSNVTHC